ncbi:unnamed protein product [Citrullus colocynthis]|uniref:Uncharacterized protein n=1 Tax=Citrullus colocynthis TaxID=252529 RepID=A0ABP0XPF7_9ROSI
MKTNYKRSSPSTPKPKTPFSLFRGLGKAAGRWDFCNDFKPNGERKTGTVDGIFVGIGIMLAFDYNSGKFYFEETKTEQSC